MKYVFIAIRKLLLSCLVLLAGKAFGAEQFITFNQGDVTHIQETAAEWLAER